MADIDASAITVGTDTNTSGTTATVPKTLTAGSSAEVCVISSSGATHNVPTSSPSETWVLIATLNDGATDAMRMSIYKADNVTGGSTVITETYSGSIGNRFMAVKEISNTTGYDSAAAAFNAQMQNAPGTGTDVVTSGATPTLSSQPALFSGWVLEKSFNNAAPTAGTGYDDDGSGGNGIAGFASVRSISKRVTSTTGQAATFTNATDRRYFTFVAAYLEAAAGPNIASVDDMTPEEGSTLVVTGTLLKASGNSTATIGGVAQTMTLQSATVPELTVTLGTLKFGTTYNLVITDSDAAPSNALALTSLQPAAGNGFVNVGTPNADPDIRLNSVAAAASGDQIEWENVALVTIYDDLTFSADDSVTTIRARIWTTGDGYGPWTEQTINAADGAGRRRSLFGKLFNRFGL